MIMSKFKNISKEFFGLREQDEQSKKPPGVPSDDDIEQVEKFKDAYSDLKDELEEAELVNSITDYQGGVVYKINDPAEASNVYNKIKTWTEGKGFKTIKAKRLADDKFFIYFRLGEDPASEAQKINGYFAQLAELDKFKFKVISQEPETDLPVPVKRPQGKI
jgi:hypothetical protein